MGAFGASREEKEESRYVQKGCMYMYRGVGRKAKGGAKKRNLMMEMREKRENWVMVFA